MKISTRLLLPALLLGSPATFAQAPAAPAEAPASAQPSAAAKTISVDFRGSLRDAIKKIAEQGGLSVIVTGELDSPSEVHLQGVTAEQALRTLARSYSLRLDNDGSIFTLRPLTAEEQRLAAVPSPGPGPGPMGPGPSRMGPPPPPMPPMPPMVPDDLDTDEIKERLRERMRKARRDHRGGKDVVARGHHLEVKEGETVDSAVVYGGNLVVRGHVEGDAVAFGGTMEVFGAVEGDVHAFGGHVILHPGAVIEGDVSSFGGTVTRSPEAHVEGSTESFGGANIGKLVAGEMKNLKGRQAEQPEAKEEREDRDDDGLGLAGFILWFATLFGVGFLGQLFFPARMKELGTEVRTRPVLNGVVGGLGTLALVPLSLVLCATIIGIPVALAAWVVVLPLAAALGIAALASEIGLRLPVLRGRKTQAVVLALGLLVLMLLGQVPVLGPLLFVFATLMGIGAVIRTRFGIRPKGMPEPILHASETV